MEQVYPNDSYPPDVNALGEIIQAAQDWAGSIIELKCNDVYVYGLYARCDVEIHGVKYVLAIEPAEK